MTEKRIDEIERKVIYSHLPLFENMDRYEGEDKMFYIGRAVGLMEGALIEELKKELES